MELIDSGLTFDDVLLLPGHSEVLPKDTKLITSITKNIKLNLPLLSAAMDTVTESNLAIAMAKQGGLGVIHKNMSIENQAQEVSRVKKFESGVITDPITVTPSIKIKDLLTIVSRHNISGVPVVDNNTLTGIVTVRDWRFEQDLDKTVASIMTPKDRLITVLEGTSQTEIIALLREHRLEKVLVVDTDFKLKGLVTVKDIQKEKDTPNASKNNFGQLRVGAAIGVGDDSSERAAELINSGVDILFVDTAHGHSQKVLDTVSNVKSKYDIAVVAGNIATSDAANALYGRGVDAVKVGIGPGSICTTRIVTGVGVPQITAINDVASALKDTKVKIIADGGIRFSGDIAKAIAAGADCVMMGGLFAGTTEAPGEVVLYQGRSYKSYRGMGSIGAMAGTGKANATGSSDRYFQEGIASDKLVPEGVEGRVPYKGSVNIVIEQLLGGLRSSMGYVGARDLTEFKQKAKFIKISPSSVKESHVHNVSITKEPPNYQKDFS